MTTTYDSADQIEDIVGATYEAITARFRITAQVMDVLSAERQALSAEITRREKDAAARLRLGALTPAERAMYRAILEARPA